VSCFFPLIYTLKLSGKKKAVDLDIERERERERGNSSLPLMSDQMFKLGQFLRIKAQ